MHIADFILIYTFACARQVWMVSVPLLRTSGKAECTDWVMSPRQVVGTLGSTLCL